MSVGTVKTISQYQGNGSDSDPYPTDMFFEQDAWISVRVLFPNGNEETLAQNEDYTLTGAGDPGGGNVVTAEAYDEDHTITIARIVPLTQLLALGYNQTLNSALLEKALDKLTFIAQQLAGESAVGDRSLRFPFSEPASNNTTLPTPVLRRDTVVFFDPVTGELLNLRLDQLAQRLLVILGAEAVLPYRTREISESITIEQEDVNSSIRANSVSDIVVTLPTTDDISDNFFATLSRFSSGAVEFTAPSGVIIESAVGQSPRIFGTKKPVGIQVIGVNRWWVFGDIY